jgi:hypothetical protein
MQGLRPCTINPRATADDIAKTVEVLRGHGGAESDYLFVSG